MPKFGELREDGYRFRCLRRVGDKVYENWLSPAAWQNMRDRLAKWRRDDYRANPEKNRKIAREWARIYRKREPLRYALAAARARSKKYGIEFSITLDDLFVPTRCPVFGIPLTHGTDSDSSAEIDRIVNANGYIPGNVIVVSRRANRMKGDATLAELQTLVRFYERTTPLAQSSYDYR